MPSNIPEPEEFVQEQTLLESHTSELDQEIIEQFEIICPEPNARPRLRKTKSLPKSKKLFPCTTVKLPVPTETKSSLVMAASSNELITENPHINSTSMDVLRYISKAKYLPRRNTSLSTFWNIVDKQGLTPMKPTTYLPDTADLATLNARLKSGHIQFERFSDMTECANADVTKSMSLNTNSNLENITFDELEIKKLDTPKMHHTEQWERQSIDLVWDDSEQNELLKSYATNSLVGI